MQYIRSITALSLCTLLIIFVDTAYLTAQTPGLPQHALTIDEVVAIALERNLQISSSQSNVETSGARVTTAFGEFLPTLRLAGNYNKQLSEGTAFLNGISLGSNRPDNSMQASISADVLLFDGFRRTASYNAAQSTFNASVQSLNRTRQDIVYQTRGAFLEVLRTERIVDVRRNDLDVAREQLARTRGLVEAGAAQVGSIYSQEAEVANSELAIEQALTDATIARNRLSVLLNVDPTTRINLSSAGLAQSMDSNDVALSRQRLGSRAELYEKQISTRPDILAARLNVESARSRVSASRSGYYPTISSSLGWGWQRSAQDAGPVTSSSAQLSIDVQYTAFDGFRTGEQVELADAQRQSHEIDLRRLELEARSALEQSLARLDGAERQLRAAEKAVLAARQNRFATDERYKVGVGSYTDYLLANNQYLTAQINQVNAVFNYRLALYEIQYQIGE
jgi:outer membrane protein